MARIRIVAARWDVKNADASLEFLFSGATIVLPVIAIYTIGVYWVFRGKLRRT
jgi:cytochrome bd ubiquinol oxidase subunit II